MRANETGRPQASVIIPCRNAARTVRAAVASALAQTCRDLEVLAVDDGSTDDTAAVLAACAAADARVRVFAIPPRGVSAARNRGLTEARGAWVFFLDADDVMLPALVATVLARLAETRADYALFAYGERDAATGAMRQVPLKADYAFDSAAAIRAHYLPRILGYSHDDVRRWYAGGALGAHREMAGVWRAAFRRDLIARHGVRFDETVEIFEDALFNAEYLLRATRMTSLDVPLYRYTASDAGSMNAKLRGAVFFDNKLRLLAARNRLNAQTGGALAPLYAASCVFSLLELLRAVLTRHPGWRQFGGPALHAYATDPVVRAALRTFPCSPRHPLLAMAVCAARLLGCLPPRRTISRDLTNPLSQPSRF